MRLIKQNFERDGSGLVTLFPEEPEDMWYAYNLIRPKDLLRASALRRVVTESATGSTSSTRVHTTLTIRVESLDFDPQSSQLHVSGRIAEETKFTKVGQYHTLDLELQRNFTLTKDGEEAWDSVARGIIKEACDPVRSADVWAVVMQEGLANLAVLTGARTVLRQRVELSIPRKRGGRASDHDKGLEKFFQTTLDTLLRQIDLNESKPILLASPGFTASSFQKFIIDTATRTGNKALMAQKANLVVVHSSSGHLHALNEILQTPEVTARLKDTQYAREGKLMDEFMTLLRKDDGRAWYGPNEVEKAVEKGAVGRGGGVLLISNALFRAQDVAIRRRWVRLVDKVRDVEGGEVRTLSSEHESGKRLDGLGGIAAILTFPLDDLSEEEEGEEEESEIPNGNTNVAIFLIPINWLPHHNWDDGWSSDEARPASQGMTYRELQDLLLETPNEAKAREWSQYYTAGPHLAGKNLTQALWTREKWQEFGVQDSNIVAYDVYLNYPLDHRLALLESRQKGAGEQVAGKDYDIKYECKLEEDVLHGHPTMNSGPRVPTFHGYSANGDVTAQYVYVNFGTFWDFDDLVKANVSLEGKIAIVKYGRGFRGLKVKRAQELGMVGVLIYSDPQEDGDITEQNGYKTYPDGPARNPSSVQRGSVDFITTGVGDPTTIGYPSKPGVPRQDPSHTTPSIPSLPISYQDALPLLQALNGHGPQASNFNEYWQGGGLGYKNVSYNIGPSPSSLKLNLMNKQEYVTTPIWNVIGIINGSLADEVVILGNHRDAWIAGGAADPNSGSAALNEVVRSFGLALEKGWKPLRTIVFASWDGEEYNLLGSTEWVEEYLPWLSNAAVAYLNVDVACMGSDFMATASPLLHKAIYDATSMVQSPNQTVPGQTVRDTWDGHIKTIGSGSDYTAFQDFAGVPSVDMAYRRTAQNPVYHYHSNYDSFHWMEEFGDKHWQHHLTMAKLWALTAVSLIENPIIHFHATDYAKALASYVQKTKSKAGDSNKLDGTSSESSTTGQHHQAAFLSLEAAVERLHNATVRFDRQAAAVQQQVQRGDIPWWKWWQKVKLSIEVKKVNDRYKYLERQFLHEDGLDGRSWYKHVVFAPGRWTGYAGATLPGLTEAVEDRNATGVEKWSKIIEGKIDAATRSLKY
ncbi:MAG: hypothetical protein Q9210_006279 [Variospora velana]